MSEYERTYLHSELQGHWVALFMDAMSIVSAFLVASFLLAHRLSRLLAGIVIALYTYTVWNMAVLLTKAIVDTMGLDAQIRALAASGKGLTWHSAVHFPQPDWVPDWAFYIVSAEFGVVYVASLMFFFYCRRHGSSGIVLADQASKPNA